jgi:hypothetical protein
MWKLPVKRSGTGGEFTTHATACNAVDRAISLSIEISGVVEIDSLGWGLITL